MSETTIEGTSPVRAFWPGDYARFASIIKGVRRDHGDGVANEILGTVSAVLAGDSPAFDAAKFAAGTYQMPRYYGDLARVLKQARHVKCQPYTAKPAEQQDTVDQMAQGLAALFSTDTGFDPDKFVASAKLPEPQNQLLDSPPVVTAGSVDDFEDEHGEEV